MLRSLWNRIDHISIKPESKCLLFRIALEIPSGLAGLLLWLILRSWCLKTWDWMVCFVGYPVIAAWFFAVLFCWRHEFRNSGS